MNNVKINIDKNDITLCTIDVMDFIKESIGHYEIEPTEETNTDRSYEYPANNYYHYDFDLKVRYEGVTLDCDLPAPNFILGDNEWGTAAAEKLLDYLNKYHEMNGTGRTFEVRHDNTYNGPNDLNSEFNFSVVYENGCDYIYEGDCFIVLNNHLGGDPRGNYDTKTRIFHVSDGELGEDCSFFYTELSWYLETIDGDSSDIDEYTSSYQREPSYALENDSTHCFYSEVSKCWLVRLNGQTYKATPYTYM